MVGRRADRLLDLQSEIEFRFEIASEVVPADQSTEEGRSRIAAKVEELDATAALLAAGLTSVGQFDANKISDYHSLIETNVLGFTDLLARIVSIFKLRRSETAILAISSLGAETSLPVLGGLRRLEGVYKYAHSGDFCRTERDECECRRFLAGRYRYGYGSAKRFALGADGADGRRSLRCIGGRSAGAAALHDSAWVGKPCSLSRQSYASTSPRRESRQFSIPATSMTAKEPARMCSSRRLGHGKRHGRK